MKNESQHHAGLPPAVYRMDLHRSRYEPGALTRILKNLQKLLLLTKLDLLHGDLVERMASCYSHRISDQCSSICRMQVSSHRI
jgi:hypothetical protein